MRCPTCGENTDTKVEGIPFCGRCQSAFQPYTGDEPGIRYIVKAKQTYPELKGVPVHSPPDVGKGTRQLPLPEVYADEAALVQAIKADLEREGWRVLRVGQFVAKGAGTDVGCPDLFVTQASLQGHWLALEVKMPGGKVKPEQQRLCELGLSRIVRSVADARFVCRLPERRAL